MEGGKKMKEHVSIDKILDKLFIEKSKENADKKNQENKNYEYKRQRITKQIKKLQTENQINLN
jgi:hypothetical protein